MPLVKSPALTIELCSSCRGSGLQPGLGNLDIKAKEHKKYEVCQKCNGKGVPPVEQEARNRYI